MSPRAASYAVGTVDGPDGRLPAVRWRDGRVEAQRPDRPLEPFSAAWRPVAPAVADTFTAGEVSPS